MVFEPPGGVRCENGDKLEFDDLLNKLAMFSQPQVSQNELTLIPKRLEKRKKSREEATREQRSAKSGLQNVSGAL